MYAQISYFNPNKNFPLKAGHLFLQVQFQRIQCNQGRVSKRQGFPLVTRGEFGWRASLAFGKAAFYQFDDGEVMKQRGRASDG